MAYLYKTYSYTKLCAYKTCVNRTDKLYCNDCTTKYPELAQLELEALYKNQIINKAQYKKVSKLASMQARKRQEEIECIEVDFSE